MEEPVGGPLVVAFVPAAVNRPLRREVLRPHLGPEAAVYPGDDDPRAGHVAATEGGIVLAVGSVLPEAPGWAPAGWRVRGMATVARRRGEGIAGAVLALLLAHVTTHGGDLVWCNARIPARRLYERAGFEGRGEVFDLPGIGPHVVMWRAVPAGESIPGVGSQ